MLLVGLLGFLFGLLVLPARATYGARTTADEPQYLLSALSVWEDGSLDIGDELAAERWRDFHEADLPVQTEPLADGRTISPHDPLLPVLLAVPVGLGGWIGAKVALAAAGGALAAVLVFTAHRRFGVPVPIAGVVVAAAAVSPPLAAYAGQVYPELPAALAVAVAVASITGPLERRGRWAFAAAVTALPWLAVKYVPVAACLAAAGLWRLGRRAERRAATCVAVGLGLTAVAYAVAHRLLYGGWTVYAAGDHFTGGELTVVGSDPDYAGRSRRLLGLLVDRDFGLLRWAPLWALAVPAVGALLRRRPPGTDVVLLPLGAGWAVAAWVALTMHGWWWPGRQVVVVLPLAVLAVAWWAAQVRGVATLAAALGAVGAASWLWLLFDVVVLDHLRLIIDFAQTSNPLSRWWRLALPELRTPLAGDWLRYAAWLVLAAAGALLGWRSVAPRSRAHPEVPERIPIDAPV
ncbi:MAG TPA: hypothetical protein VFO65_05795 [Acidimicrobiales bacterium]|nr:hypothetical protein [Acidimicrobiales bacterium]